MHVESHILIVDDDLEIRKLLGRYLAEQGFRVTLASDKRMLASVLWAVSRCSRTQIATAAITTAPTNATTASAPSLRRAARSFARLRASSSSRFLSASSCSRAFRR